MKKFVSGGLILVMMLLLSVPAFAAGEPLWQQMGYQSLIDCLNSSNITEEQYNAIAAKAEGSAPEDFRGTMENDYLYMMMLGDAFALEEDSEEFRRLALQYWFIQETAIYHEQNFRNSFIASVGGTPGEINVLVDGTCIPFTRVHPAMISGRTMVPLRESMEFLGARVDYDSAARTASVSGEGIAFTHVIGTDVITMAGGQVVQMDVASVVRNGSTMVPLRFFSQALGYDLYWDKYFRWAVVFDKERIIAEYDKSFTILNELIQKYGLWEAPALPISQETSISAEIKLLDSINGDQTYKISGKLEALVDEETVNLSGRLDLSDVLQLWELPELLEELPPHSERYFAPLTVEGIMTGEEAYFKVPLFNYLLREQAGIDISDSTWLSGEGAEITVSELADRMIQQPLVNSASLAEGEMPVTMGRLLYESLAAQDDGSGEAYQYMDRTAELLAAILGDDTWHKSGSTYTWHLGMEELSDIAAMDSTMEIWRLHLSKFSADMTIRPDGKARLSLEAVSDGYYGRGAAKYTLQGTGGLDGQISFTGTAQLQNTCDIRFRIDRTTKTSGKKPAQTPPAGDAVLQIEELGR